MPHVIRQIFLQLVYSALDTFVPFVVTALGVCIVYVTIVIETEFDFFETD
jgi:hypothetical protein